MTEVFDIGEYGMYIWPAWGLALLMLGGLVIASVRVMRARERELAELEAAKPRRRRQKNPEGKSA